MSASQMDSAKTCELIMSDCIINHYNHAKMSHTNLNFEDDAPLRLVNFLGTNASSTGKFTRKYHTQTQIPTPQMILR